MKQTSQLHKFGGASLADPPSYKRVASIISHYGSPTDLIVVSAAGDTTDQLIQWTILSRKDPAAAQTLQEEIAQFQIRLIAELLDPPAAEDLIFQLNHSLTNFSSMLHGTLTDAISAEVVGHGEVWSARLLSALLNQLGMKSSWIDARDFLRAERGVQPKIDAGHSYPLLAQKLAQYQQQRLVITGFICRNNAGESVLLGRNGSDYSATQIAALAGVEAVTLWRDVAGIYSADPLIVKDACLLHCLRLDEASELARLSSPVLHARSLQPLLSSNLELRLRYSCNPLHGSTRIHRVIARSAGAQVITSHKEVDLIELSLPNQMDLSELHAQLNCLLQQAQLTPLTWKSDQVGAKIQWSFTAAMSESALSLLRSAAPPGELRRRTGFSMVAMVGAGISHNLVHCDQFHRILSAYPVEHYCIAEEGHSLAAVVAYGDPEPILHSLHRSIFRHRKRVGLVLFGRQGVGARWLTLFSQGAKKLSDRTSMEFILAGVVDDGHAWLDYRGLTANRVLAFFDDEAQRTDHRQILQWLTHHPFDAMIVLDVGNSLTLTDHYVTLAESGFHLISHNDFVGTVEDSSYRAIEQAFSRSGAYWLCRSSSGSIPFLHNAIRELRETGDTIHSITGSFCGALSWIFCHYDGKEKFTETVRQAWQQGFTHRDPRVELSGKGALHELVAMARTSGALIEPTSVRVESLITKEVDTWPLDRLFEEINPINASLAQRAAAARAAGLHLRHVARFVADEPCRIGVEALMPDHPVVSCQPHEQAFMIQSSWYPQTPLVIRTPAHGDDLRSAAIQSDLYRLALQL